MDGGYAGCHADVFALTSEAERASAVGLVGKPGSLADVTSSSDVALWAPWQQEIALTIGGASDGGDAALRLAEWAKAAALSEPLIASLYRTTLQADMAGQLFVRAVEVPESLPEQRRSLRDEDRPAFLDVPFEEAIRLFQERRLVSPEEFRQLSDDARTRAFTATRLATEQVRERAYRLLLDALQSGSTLEEFAAKLRSEETSLGITASDPGYVTNVYRTNVASAYGAGRYRQLRSPLVRQARPFVQYRTANDSRVRASHAALHGLVFSQDDPGWPRLAPPNGFQCRCVVVARRDAGGRVTDAASLNFTPDAGFDSAPAIDFTS